MNDLELVEKIQQTRDNNCLSELIERHSAICYKVYQKFLPSLAASGVCVNDLSKDKDYVIYQAALSFNPEKKVKYSSWLYNYVRYQCLTALTNKNKILYLESDKIDYLMDKQKHTNFQNDDLKNYILTILENLKDKRLIEIFKLRHFSYNNKKLSWREISEKIGYSSQTCINLHEKICKILRKELKKDNIKNYEQ